MRVEYSEADDFEAWLALAREVEPLFGPMADDAGFQAGLKMAIEGRTAFCIRSEEGLKGGIVIAKESNEIAWLAVSRQYRQRGCGRELLSHAISQLDQQKSILVQTFAEAVPAGASARKLYAAFGFADLKEGGLNPAGVPTVIMRRAPEEAQDM